MKNKKTSVINILIDFFASLYDLVIALFAFIYDSVYDLVFFLLEYTKWVTTINATKTNHFDKQEEEKIKIYNQNHIDI